MDFIKTIAALIFVLCLIWAFAYVLKRFGFGGVPRVKQKAERRLEILEILPLEPRKRLLLIRRDDQEHLILSGPESDVVVETIPNNDSKKVKGKKSS